VHAVQAARKDAGLNVEDRISLTLEGDDELLDAARAHQDYVAGETLATSVEYDGAGGSAAEAKIEGRRLLISVSRR
jgi:isoleucyl-tRNA synthetase